MGYWTRPELVIMNEVFLQAVLTAVHNSSTCYVDMDQSIPNQVYKLREILASAAEYPSLFEGRFANLQQSVRIRREPAFRRIAIASRAASIISSLPRVQTAIESTPIPDDLMQELRHLEHDASPPKRSSFIDKLKQQGKGLPSDSDS